MWRIAIAFLKRPPAASFGLYTTTSWELLRLVGQIHIWYANVMRETMASSRERHVVRLGDRGRIVLPAWVRKRLGVKEGDRFVLRLEEDGALRLLSGRKAAAEARGILKELLPGLPPQRSLPDELIADRRAEAERE